MSEIHVYVDVVIVSLGNTCLCGRSNCPCRESKRYVDVVTVSVKTPVYVDVVTFSVRNTC
jgi:hypothetical protein